MCCGRCQFVVKLQPANPFSLNCNMENVQISNARKMLINSAPVIFILYFVESAN